MITKVETGLTHFFESSKMDCIRSCSDIRLTICKYLRKIWLHGVIVHGSSIPPSNPAAKITDPDKQRPGQKTKTFFSSLKLELNI